MTKNMVLALLILVPFYGLANSLTDSTPGYLEEYQYQVTDIATRGLNSARLFSELETSWMDLEHSVCANRALVWGYDLEKKYKIKTGKIFVFFISDLWKNDKKGWMYHAGTYVVENGKEVFLERSYPEVTKPLTLLEWMDNEMEGRANAKDCIEISKKDTDLTKYFYARRNLPRVRESKLPGAPCYYRKVPGYIAYPATLAELDFKKDANGKPVDYSINAYDREEVYAACVDAVSGGKWSKRKEARGFCASRY